MARKRMLSPSFFTSKPVASLSIPAMVTLAGLWCYLDDYGRGEDDTSMIKAEVWPRRRAVGEREIGKHLAEIEAQRLVCRYQVNSESLLHIPSWGEHQKVSHPQKETVPPCEFHEPEAWSLFTAGELPHLSRFVIDLRTVPERFANVSGRTPE